MHFTSTLLSLSLAAVSVNAASVERRQEVGLLDDALVFDAAAFPDPANAGQTLVGLQSFVSLRQIDLGPILDGLSGALGGIGLEEIGDGIATVEERIRLVGAIGLAGQEVTVNVDGCSQPVTVGRTSGFPDLGMVLANVSLGECGAGKELVGTVELGALDNRNLQATVFNSPDSGFGVISDVDDTIKISNVLDTLALARSTLIDEPKAVEGMPELYASLTQSLNDPQFIYVSGSPFQLFPFLSEFIATSYPASRGPLLLQNLTVLDIGQLIDFVQSDGIDTYKNDMVDRIVGMYPNKVYLTVGDSTQRDPEVYAAAFNTYGEGVISCIWIRAVEGADNSEERFATTFAGIPETRFRIYQDADIPSLAQIDVAGGQC